ncbi:hypothetical protein ATO13_23321 [Stappia sp. 22II-S9-Z10]|nr:hypothetical protein ATO13_23321 [Stappia sp. 22II-S9-Z10]
MTDVVDSLRAENERLRAALERVRDTAALCTPIRYVQVWEAVHSIARAALAETALDEMTATAQRDGDYGTPEGTR